MLSNKLSLGFYEPNPKTDSFAKQLRLWQHHLGLPAEEQRLIEDPLLSIAKVWSKIRFLPGEIQSEKGTRFGPNVVRYNWSGDQPLGTIATALVDVICDPVVTSDETKRVPRR